MSKKYGTFASDILIAIGDATGFFSWPLEHTDGWRYKQIKQLRSKKVYDQIFQLKKRGLVCEVSRKGKKFFELTKKGQLETLFLKSHFVWTKPEKWDGKWRLAIFDIPEDARSDREKLRRLLRARGFRLLQASVFVSPWPMSREALDYLKQSGLMSYIRFARIDEMDNDKDLRQKFKLL